MSSGHLTHLTHSTMTAGLTPKMSTMRRRAAFMRTVPVGRTPTSTHTAQAATIIHPTRWYAKSVSHVVVLSPHPEPCRRSSSIISSSIISSSIISVSDILIIRCSIINISGILIISGSSSNGSS